MARSNGRKVAAQWPGTYSGSMDRGLLAYFLAALAVCALLIQLVLGRVRRARARWRAKQRSRRAFRGERDAETLLARLGYDIEDRQVPIVWTIVCDGEQHSVELRADLIARRGNDRFVAEVKTGRRAPQLTTPATRRQLLEYRLAYDVDGVLLVDPEAGRVSSIEFPLTGGAGPRGSSASGLALAFIIGAALGCAAVLWLAGG